MKLKKQNLYLQKFYRYIDSIFLSYWLGKFINNFIQSGNKATIEKEFKKVYTYAKINKKQNISLIFLECMEKIKPLTSLKSVTVSGKVKEYPILLNKYKQRTLALKNLSGHIMEQKNKFLNQKVINTLLDYKINKNNLLIKKQNENFKISAQNRFNIRFSKRRKRYKIS